ncbi:unnamed protein product, partial [Meganyctiphanes norvegica]
MAIAGPGLGGGGGSGGGSQTNIENQHVAANGPKAASYRQLPQGEEPPTDNDEGNVGLKPKLSLLNGVTICVGTIIGSGIFISPGGVLANTGSVNMSLVVWILSGLFSMVGSYCFAELGCMIKKPGGEYTYVHMSFGPFVGFMKLWVECMIVRPCTLTIVALTFAVYVMQPFFPTCENPQASARMLAAVCIGKIKQKVFPGCWMINMETRDVARLLSVRVYVPHTTFISPKMDSAKHFTLNGQNKAINENFVDLAFLRKCFFCNLNFISYISKENLCLSDYLFLSYGAVLFIMNQIQFSYSTFNHKQHGLGLFAHTWVNMSWVMPFLMGQLVAYFINPLVFVSLCSTLLTSQRLFLINALEHPHYMLMLKKLPLMVPAPDVLFMEIICFLSYGGKNIRALIGHSLSVVCLSTLRGQPDTARKININSVKPTDHIM